MFPLLPSSLFRFLLFSFFLFFLLLPSLPYSSSCYLTKPNGVGQTHFPSSSSLSVATQIARVTFRRQQQQLQRSVRVLSTQKPRKDDACILPHFPPLFLPLQFLIRGFWDVANISRKYFFIFLYIFWNRAKEVNISFS